SRERTRPGTGTRHPWASRRPPVGPADGLDGERRLLKCSGPTESSNPPSNPESEGVATSATASARRSERALWNERALAWERWEPALMNGLAAVNPFLFRALQLEPGQRILDLGCGTGDPALALAQWVGPRGRVLGIDNSDAMLGVAKRRARILRLRNVT